jgi:ATP-dependent helicase/DNAse subunit B
MREVSLTAVENKFRETVKTIASGIERGLFPANPGSNGKDNCLFCDFKRICHADRNLMWERKSGAPELELYLKLINDESTEEDAE